MEIKIFKFGGASVNSAEGIRNLASILRKFPDDPILMVVSAMGKTTNVLEELLHHFTNLDPVPMIDAFFRVHSYHLEIIGKLFPDKTHPVYIDVENLFDLLRGHIRRGHCNSGQMGNYNYEYDQIVSYGELISTTIIYHYLNQKKISSALTDARNLIRTDSTFRDARVNWNETKQRISKEIPAYFNTSSNPSRIVITQGFIGSDGEGNTTTLGREGSDYTASVFAYCLNIKEITIWKDVPGVMNADPKWFPDAVKIDRLSYREAIELAYYGASVIHPKTIKPLENAGITLHVRSFHEPETKGTIVENLSVWKISTPIYIRKQNQVLISISPRDFSFIVEENLSEIFDLFARFLVKVNVMQNSAISFTVSVDDNPRALPGLLKELKKKYSVRYNEEAELYTIRHYSASAIKKVTQNKKVLLEQKTRNTVHLVVIPG